MKNMAWIMPIMILWLVIGVSAQEPGAHEGCPAHQAAEQGVDFIGKLHQVMAPAWHSAYPEKDYAALGKAMNKFAAMIPDVKKVTHTFKTAEREANFNAARKKFIELVEKGAAAGTESETEIIYELMPDVHMSFEEMAYYLLPVSFPEFQSLVTVVNLMIDEHLKKEDYAAVATSVEALKIKNTELQKAKIPEDLKSVKKEVITDILAIGKACEKLETACQADDPEEIAGSLNNLKELCKKFEHNYI
jgi:hypothetical protein